jgi:hypothetical protein
MPADALGTFRLRGRRARRVPRPAQGGCQIRLLPDAISVNASVVRTFPRPDLGEATHCARDVVGFGSRDEQRALFETPVSAPVAHARAGNRRSRTTAT